mmetsp:Transcript_103775/g.334554  ORF Transcript_103775/g.334554 Transcript_103775/m.334554 type:complete len:229 (+) Transcript_103775:141-827(+)
MPPPNFLLQMDEVDLEHLCACGLDNAACGACGRGWAQQEQARLGFFEVPSLGTASAMWVRGGTEGYPNSVSKWYFLHRSVEAPCPMVGKCTFLAPLSERKKLVDMLPEAALQSRIWDKPEVPVQVVADVLAGLAKGKGPRAMYACPKCELSFFKWQVCLKHCRGSPCADARRHRTAARSAPRPHPAHRRRPARERRRKGLSARAGRCRGGRRRPARRRRQRGPAARAG